MTGTPVQRAIVAALREASDPGDDYRRRHLVTHAAAAGLLGRELDIGTVLGEADPDRLVTAVAPLVFDRDTPPGQRHLAMACLQLGSRLAPMGAAARQASVHTVLAWERPGRPADPPAGPVAWWPVLLSTPPSGSRWVYREPGAWIWRTAMADVAGRLLLAAAGHNGLVYVTDLTAGALAQVLTGHGGPVTAVAFATLAGAPALVTASFDRTVRVWDPATGEPLARWSGHQRGLWDVAVGTVAGRTVVATGSADGTVRLWDPDRGGTLLVLHGHRDWVWRVAFGELDGRPVLASGSDDATVRVWDALSGEPLRVLTHHRAGVSAVGFGTVGGRPVLVSGSFDGTVQVTDPVDWSTVAVLSGHSDWVRDVRVVPWPGGTDLLVSSGDDGTVRVWDPATGTDTCLTGHLGAAYTAAAVRWEDAVWVASGGVDGTVRLWEAAPPSGAGRATARLSADAVSAGRVTARLATEAVTADTDAPAGGVDADTPAGAGRPTVEPPAGGVDADAPVAAVAIVRHGDGWLVAGAGDDGLIRLWSVDRAAGAVPPTPTPGTPPPGTPRGPADPRVLTGHAARITGVAWVPGAGPPTLVSTDIDAVVALWDLATGRRLTTLNGHIGPVGTVTAGVLDGVRLIVTGGFDGYVRLWDATRATELRALRVGADWLGAAQLVTVAGRDLLAVGGYDGVIHLIDVRTGETVARQPTGGGAVTALAWTGGTRSGDTRSAASPAGEARSAAFLPGDTRSAASPPGDARSGQPVLLSAGTDGGIRRWRPGPDRIEPVPGSLTTSDGQPLGLATGRVADRTVVASVTSASTADLYWDPAATVPVPLPYGGRCCAMDGDLLAIGLERGLIALRLTPALFEDMESGHDEGGRTG